MLDRRTLGLTAAATVVSGQARAAVETDSGAVRGMTGGGVEAFTGIPFAAPPVGGLRYRSPRPPAPWSGVLDATKPGAASIQTLAGAAAWLYDGADPQSEDCLFLNVWTPSTQGSRPVMVWFHGGAWRTGHGLVAGTNGSELARRGDVVVVTVNYRLGVLGWLAHPDLADPETGTFANWGHQDQVAALRWVQRNIAAFGGDPARVTIFGQSAGGQSVATIAQNPKNAGLFSQAIVESGSLHGAPGFPEPATAARYAEAIARALGTNVRGLAGVPARTLHETELRTARDPAIVRGIGRPPILPVLDGIVLSAWPRDGALPAVPLLIGTTRTEGTFWYDLVGPDGALVPGLRAPESDAAFDAMLRDLIGVYRPEAAALPVAAVLEAYRPAGDMKAQWIEAYTDIVFRLRALDAARRHAGAGHATWLYEFQRPLAPPGRGVPHTSEIPFVFGTYAHPFFASKCGTGPESAELSGFMLDAWAAFAHHGAPGAGWVGVSPDSKGVNLLGGPDGVLTTADAVRAERTAVWTSAQARN